MNSICLGCEYFEKDTNLQNYCVHRKFCLRAYEEGLKTNSVISSVMSLPTNSQNSYIFTMNSANHSAEELQKVCSHIQGVLFPVPCLFIPEGIVNSWTGDHFQTTVRNKFLYKDDDYALIDLSGKVFSPVVKDAIAELTGQEVVAYNEFQIIICKLKEDYRNAGDTETDSK